MMDKTSVKKTSLHDSADVCCTTQSPDECLAVLAELNRIGLAALGLVDRPLQRSSIRKFSFREFTNHSSTPFFP